MSTGACASYSSQGERGKGMSGKKDSRGTIEFRLYSRIRIDSSNGCWNWIGAISNNRYGSLYWDGRMQKTHRIAWILKNGKIPVGMDLDHLCRNTRCCNPSHLEVVTRSENLRRSPLMDRKSQNTHCPSGHEYGGQNLRLTKKGYRVCKTCMRQHTRDWRARCEAVL
jgi:hypothetical protein